MAALQRFWMEGVVAFFGGLWGMPVLARLWVGLLVAVNGLAPLGFWALPEARVTLLVFLLGGLAMFVITQQTGFTRLNGLGHFLWFGLLPWLFFRLPLHPVDTDAGLWLRLLLAVNTVSLVIDVADVVRYARGDRAEL